MNTRRSSWNSAGCGQSLSAVLSLPSLHYLPSRWISGQLTTLTSTIHNPSSPHPQMTTNPRSRCQTATSTSSVNNQGPQPPVNDLDLQSRSRPHTIRRPITTSNIPPGSQFDNERAVGRQDDGVDILNAISLEGGLHRYCTRLIGDQRDDTLTLIVPPLFTSPSNSSRRR